MCSANAQLLMLSLSSPSPGPTHLLVRSLGNLTRHQFAEGLGPSVRSGLVAPVAWERALQEGGYAAVFREEFPEFPEGVWWLDEVW